MKVKTKMKMKMGKKKHKEEEGEDEKKRLSENLEEMYISGVSLPDPLKFLCSSTGLNV